MAEKTSTEAKPSLEEALKKREEEINKLHEENPDMTPSQDNKWWIPATKLGFDTENTLGEEENRKLNGILKKAFESNFDLEVTKAALEEPKSCLVGHDDILKQYEAIFSSVDNEMIDSFRHICQPDKKKDEGTS